MKLSVSRRTARSEIILELNNFSVCFGREKEVAAGRAAEVAPTLLRLRRPLESAFSSGDRRDLVSAGSVCPINHVPIATVLT